MAARMAKSATAESNARKRQVEDRDVQTEASYHAVISDVPKKLTDLGSKQFEDLKHLRDLIKIAMTELGCTTYDILAYKDVVLSISNSLPEMPVSDLLLLSSKLFRRVGDVGKMIGAFFNTVFAEDFVDEDFHFVELRIAKREIAALRHKLQTVTDEKKALQDLYDELGKGSLDHAKALEVLENRNDVLELRSSALEDQMALLFQQVTSDFRSVNAAMMQQATEDVDVQEQLSATRTAFTQSVEIVQNRLRFFQNLLLELQEDPVLQQDSTFKNKVKSLDVHVQHIVNRFGAVKEGLLNTASELVNALVEKRKALNFSVQHLKLYDIQNTKLRQARATLHVLRQRVTEVERVLLHSFPHGAVTKVERSGEILPAAAGGSVATNLLLAASAASDNPAPQLPAGFGTSSSGGQRGEKMSSALAANIGAANDAAEAMRKSKFAVTNIRQVVEQVQLLNDSVIQLTAHLDTEDEQKGLLRTLSLAVPTAGRTDALKEKLGIVQANQKLQSLFGVPSAQQAPTILGTGAQQQGLLTSNPRGSFKNISSSRNGSLVSGGELVPAGFIGNTSSSQAGDPSAQQGDATAMIGSLRDDFVTKLNFLRDVYEERISDLEARGERTTKKLAAVTAELHRMQKEEHQASDEADREAILKAKEQWANSRETMGVEAQPTRSTALQATQELLHGQVNFGDFAVDSRPNSAKSTTESSAPSSGMQAFISPQARLQVQRQNAERKVEREQVVLKAANPANMRGPIMRNPSIISQERNEQLIRAMRRLTGVHEFQPATPILPGGAGGASPPPVSRRMSSRSLSSGSAPTSARASRPTEDP